MLGLPNIAPPEISFPNLGINKTILIAVGIFFFILLFGLLLLGLVFRRSGPVTLTWWGLWEPESVYQTVIADYQRLHPNVTVKYIKQSPINYRERLQSAIAKDDSPDIVKIHNTWLPIFKNNLEPVPQNIFSPDTFKSTFFPVVSSDFLFSNRPYAVPLGIDTLALYVNQDLFNTAGLSFPATWDEFRTTASKLTIRDSSGRVRTSGAALGAASNIDHWQDIISLMMLQAGVDPTNNPGSPEAADALAYYVTFQTRDKVWDETLDRSTLAFAKGQLAMYFGPSWRFFDFKNLNPNLNFRVLAVPQLPGGKVVNFASYWAEAVSKKSKNTKAAFEFLKYLSSDEVLTKLYSAESKLRAFGEPYPKPKMAALLATDENVGPFVLAASSAQSWYLASYTNDGDTGLNSKIGKYYEDAVNSAVKGLDPKTALETVAKGVAQALSAYAAK